MWVIARTKAGTTEPCLPADTGDGAPEGRCSKRKMKIVKKILIGIVAAPVLILIMLILMPAVLVAGIKGNISLLLFRWRAAGRVYFICTARRNWHDFLKNNVIPVLPDHYRVVWWKSAHRGKYRQLLGHLDQSRIFNVSKPYIVAVTPRALVHISLNSVLQELKARPKKSEETRRACAQIIAETEEELRTTGSSVRT